MRLGVSPATAALTGFFQLETLRLYFPVLEPWVAWSVSLPSSSQFVCMQMWDLPPPCPPWSSSCHLAMSPLCPAARFSPSYQSVWMNVFSLTLWLLDFHTVRFSGSSGCFLCLNLLSFFWLCEETKYTYLRLHLGWKSKMVSTTICEYLKLSVVHKQLLWEDAYTTT